MKAQNAILSITLLVFAENGLSQGFVNLDFEQSVITSSSPSGYGFNTGMANVPNWTSYYGWGDSNYSGGTSLIYNNQPLDSPGVSLEGTNYFTPAIQGMYSVLLQGGSYAGGIYTGWTNGASIGQTGQIPSTAQSLIYWGMNGNSLQITFNGEMLSFDVISNALNYTVYAANISAYSGQSGELLFTAPWQTGEGMVDNIQFSTLPVPEPSAAALASLGGLLLAWRLRSSHWK